MNPPLTSYSQMRMQLRVFMGAAVYKSEDVVVCPDVKSEGVISGGGTVCAPSANEYDPAKHDGFLLEVKTDSKPAFYYGGQGDSRSKLFIKNFTNDADVENLGKFKDRLDDDTAIGNDEESYPTVVYQGSTWSAGANGEQLTENSGHLGILDSVEFCGRLSGRNLYSDRPKTVKIV